MTYKIEKNIPLNQERFPFSQMEVGDSFLIEDGTPKYIVYTAARRAKVKVATKSLDTGTRVWLVEKAQA